MCAELRQWPVRARACASIAICAPHAEMDKRRRCAAAPRARAGGGRCTPAGHGMCAGHSDLEYPEVPPRNTEECRVRTRVRQPPRTAGRSEWHSHVSREKIELRIRTVCTCDMATWGLAERGPGLMLGHMPSELHATATGWPLAGHLLRSVRRRAMSLAKSSPAQQYVDTARGLARCEDTAYVSTRRATGLTPHSDPTLFSPQNGEAHKNLPAERRCGRARATGA